VLIATPDHWHVPIAIAAARAGKAIYLEKPMGLSVGEDQLLRKTVREKKGAFQFGTQQRSSRRFRQACELVRNGRIGTLKQINVWCPASRPGGSTVPAPVPPELNYDRWLGPAPQTPYTAGKCFEPGKAGLWKTWWFNHDYALGFIAGWGVHPLDIALWGHPAMMNGPIEVVGRGMFPGEGACNTAIAWEVNFAFADNVRMKFRGVRNGFEQESELNDMRPWQEKYGKITDHGTAFEGTEGWVLVDRTGIRTSPASLAEEKLGSNEPRLLDSTNHGRNLLDAIKGKSPTVCPIEDAVQADILCHLSDLATRLNRTLTWSPRQERFVNDTEADRKLELRPMREGYRLSLNAFDEVGPAVESV
jgi:predicted dehydrogenase